ncbi:hypothetical protein KCP77_22595 [Salmonella enterica subsp. enterica]|nr:hypothetical protein KCP77_22595 [Salmonella enterica subsp. enterica]
MSKSPRSRRETWRRNTRRHPNQYPFHSQLETLNIAIKAAAVRDPLTGRLSSSLDAR